MEYPVAKITIAGRVQGVWFRAFTRDQARRIGLRGWVKNRLDGSVYTEVTGEQSDIEKFILQLSNGPELSRVEDVSVEWESSDQTFDKFEIRY